MARKSKAARSRQRSNILLGSLALLLVIFVMGATAWWWSQKRNTLDPKTLCPVDGPLGHNILLVDKTDPLNLAQKSALDLLVTDWYQIKHLQATCFPSLFWEMTLSHKPNP